MPFDPTKPAAGTPITSAEMRAQFIRARDGLIIRFSAALEIPSRAVLLSPT